MPHVQYPQCSPSYLHPYLPPVWACTSTNLRIGSYMLCKCSRGSRDVGCRGVAVVSVPYPVRVEFDEWCDGKSYRKAIKGHSLCRGGFYARGMRIYYQGKVVGAMLSIPSERWAGESRSSQLAGGVFGRILLHATGLAFSLHRYTLTSETLFVYGFTRTSTIRSAWAVVVWGILSCREFHLKGTESPFHSRGIFECGTERGITVTPF